MKKSTIIASIAFLFCILLTTNVSAQKFPTLDKSPLDLASFPGRGSNKVVKVFYSRPQLKGRKIGTPAGDNSRGFVPYGRIWRTGANDATQIQFLQDVKFAGKTIEKGAYSLFTIPGEKEWVIILSSDVDNWASSGYKESNEVARLTVPATSGEDSVEAFSMVFDENMTLHMGWDTIRVAVPFSK